MHSTHKEAAERRAANVAVDTDGCNDSSYQLMAEQRRALMVEMARNGRHRLHMWQTFLFLSNLYIVSFVMLGKNTPLIRTQTHNTHSRAHAHTDTHNLTPNIIQRCVSRMPISSTKIADRRTEPAFALPLYRPLSAKISHQLFERVFVYLRLIEIH